MTGPDGRAEARREARLRRLARRRGLSLHRSRRGISPDNAGGFMVVDEDQNFVVAGSRYDMWPDDL